MAANGDLPPPPVSADVDLKDFPFTPIYRARLFGSSFHAKATDAEWRAGVTLWLKSQDQTPAGSLPDDDVELCRMAEFGRDLRAWRRVKAMALHGWRLCSDGRLYHCVVTEVVTEQWERKHAQRERTAKARAAALSQRQSHSLSHTSVTEEPTDDATETETEPATEPVTSSKGQGQGQGFKETPNPAERGFSDSRKKRANGTNPRAMGTNPRAVAAEFVPTDPWEQRCRGWAESGFWNPFWGPKPGEPGCFAPSEMAAEALRSRANGAAA